jgi:hypothetical protein
MTSSLAVPRILWGALLFSTFLYVAILELTVVEGAPDWRTLLFPLTVAGVVIAGASLVAPRILLRRRSTRLTRESTRPEGKGSYLVALLVSMAFAEGVAIVGLVLGFMGAPDSIVLPFFCVTWVLMMFQFPTEAKMAEFDS